MSATITIPVDEELARLYADATPESRAKIELLVRLYMRDWFARKPRPLMEVFDEVGRKAEANGLTEEILEEILREK